jgi:hypothetical protein
VGRLLLDGDWQHRLFNVNQLIVTNGKLRVDIQFILNNTRGGFTSQISFIVQTIFGKRGAPPGVL